MNKSMKRLLSLFMSVLMVSAMFVVPARAYELQTYNKGYDLYNRTTAPSIRQAAIPDRQYHEEIKTYWTQGRYSLSPESKVNLSLDLYRGSTDTGTNIQVADSHLGSSQDFVLEHVGNGWFVIKHTASGKVLDVANGSTENGANVLLWDYHGGNNQLWKFVKPHDYTNSYKIQSKLGERYLVTSGSNVCINETPQYWRLTSVYTLDVCFFPTNVRVGWGSTTKVAVYFRGNDLPWNTGKVFLDLYAGNKNYVSWQWGEPRNDEGERWCADLTLKGENPTPGKSVAYYTNSGRKYFIWEPNYVHYYMFAGESNTQRDIFIAVW